MEAKQELTRSPHPPVMPTLLVSLLPTVVCGLQPSVFECTVALWDQFRLLHHLFAQRVGFTAGLSEFMDC